MPMQVMADDSGCKGQGPDVVIAGLVGPSEWWAEFSDHWAACLSEPPRIGHFKMKDAAHLEGEFAGFKTAARNEKLIALTRVMNEHPFVALHVTVEVASHAQTFVPTPPEYSRKMTPADRKRWRKLHRVSFNPYFYAYHSYISAACFHLWETGTRESFEFIVDEHPSLGHRTKEWYPMVRTLMMEPLRSIMPVEPIPKADTDFLPLQAADMIAWLQRAASAATVEPAHDFEWLGEYFTQIKASHRCQFMSDQWFANVRSRAKNPDRKPLPTEALIQMAILQGAPIPRSGETWEDAKKRKKGQ